MTSLSYLIQLETILKFFGSLITISTSQKGKVLIRYLKFFLLFFFCTRLFSEFVRDVSFKNVVLNTHKDLLIFILFKRIRQNLKINFSINDRIIKANLS